MKTRGFGTNFHSIYASNAGLYDAFSRAEKFSSILEARIRELLVPGTMLDVACGTADKTNLYSKYFTAAYGLDNSQPLLCYAAKKYRTNSKLRFLWSTAAHIPLLDESVDTVLVTWGSFPLSRTLREMKRVLKNGGSILRIGACVEDEFTTLFPSFDIRRINRINRTFISQGFTIEHHEVAIRFKNLKEAKGILTTIIGVPKEMIIKKAFRHKVALCYYKKV
jgi:ubiquinone/menaquinone biosynthesis C-methylase UbiE